LWSEIVPAAGIAVPPDNRLVKSQDRVNHIMPMAPRAKVGSSSPPERSAGHLLGLTGTSYPQVPGPDP
jgi:hypothetical protein